MLRTTCTNLKTRQAKRGNRQIRLAHEKQDGTLQAPYHSLPTDALHEPLEARGRLSQPRETTKTISCGAEQLPVLQLTVPPRVEHLEHHPDALRAEVLARHHFCSAGKIVLSYRLLGGGGGAGS